MHQNIILGLIIGAVVVALLGDCDTGKKGRADFRFYFCAAICLVLFLLAFVLIGVFLVS